VDINIATNTQEAIPNFKKLTVWEKIKRDRVSYFMIAPFMILFIIFTVIPVVSSCLLSFTYFNMFEFPKWRGWMNYQRLFLEDDVFLIAIKNTLKFAVITGPVGYVFCYLFAWFINELPKKTKSFMTLVFYAPAIAGPVAIWLIILSGDMYGYLNAFLMYFGVISDPKQWLTDPATNFVAIVVVQLWLSLGTSFLALLAGFNTIDRSLYEAGSIDGIRNRFQELVYITIPAMKDSMLFAAVMNIASAFAVGPITIQLAGFPSTDYSVHTIVNHIYDYGTLRYEMGYASAMAFLLCVVMVLTKNVISKILKPD
jgi:multiple sugar transport system permease protein